MSREALLVETETTVTLDLEELVYSHRYRLAETMADDLLSAIGPERAVEYFGLKLVPQDFDPKPLKALIEAHWQEFARLCYDRGESAVRLLEQLEEMDG